MLNELSNYSIRINMCERFDRISESHLLSNHVENSFIDMGAKAHYVFKYLKIGETTVKASLNEKEEGWEVTDYYAHERFFGPIPGELVFEDEYFAYYHTHRIPDVKIN